MEIKHVFYRGNLFSNTSFSCFQTGKGLGFLCTLSDQQQVSFRFFLSADNKLDLLSICQQQGPPSSDNQKLATVYMKRTGWPGVLWQFLFTVWWVKELLALLRQGCSSIRNNRLRVVLHGGPIHLLNPNSCSVCLQHHLPNPDFPSMELHVRLSKD